MKVNIFQILYSQRRKGAQADMQRNARDLYALCLQRVQHLRSKVKPGCGRCHGAGFPRKNSLIAIAVRIRIVAADVGRERHVADAFEGCEEIFHRLEAKQPLAELPALQHLSLKLDQPRRPRKDKPFADSDLSGRAHESAPKAFASWWRIGDCGLPGPRIGTWGTRHLWNNLLGEQHLDHSGRLLPVAHRGPLRIKPSGNHTAVVQHQHVAGRQQRRKLRKLRIAQKACRAIHDQHAALAARGGRLLRNQLRRQVEVEVGNAQAGHPAAFLK